MEDHKTWIDAFGLGPGLEAFDLNPLGHPRLDIRIHGRVRNMRDRFPAGEPNRACADLLKGEWWDPVGHCFLESLSVVCSATRPAHTLKSAAYYNGGFLKLSMHAVVDPSLLRRYNPSGGSKALIVEAVLLDTAFLFEPGSPTSLGELCWRQ